MLKLHIAYHPITANPFSESISYAEYEPCEALKPYIRCFWGSKIPYRQRKTSGFDRTIVIPDTCMDVIFIADFTNNSITSSFCGISDCPFISGTEDGEERVVSAFAVRFYPWSVSIFAEDSMRGTKNTIFEAGQHFSKMERSIAPLLFEVADMKGRIAVAEDFLMKYINKATRNFYFYGNKTYPLKYVSRERAGSYVENAVAEMISKRGNVGLAELTENVPVGSRQLQRIFQEYVGVPPKQLATLIRYQYLWSNLLYEPHFCVQDAVFRYGYTDQSHLLREFKRFHGTTVSKAREYAVAGGILEC